MKTEILRFAATVKLKGKDKPVTFQQRFGRFKFAYRWVMDWNRKAHVTTAEIFDLDRTERAWTSMEGLLQKYRTVKPQDAPPFLSASRKPDYGITAGTLARSNPGEPTKPAFAGVGKIQRSKITP